nr:molybdenum cofactor guanylyltransferase [Chloroflexota bacterium]
MPKVSAVVLAGGKSQRLGMDKAQLKLNGKWLLQQILETLSNLSDDLLVVADKRLEIAQLSVRVVPDAYPGTGPLGGIYSGLQAMRYERGVVVACDMPFLSLPLLRYMILLSADFDAVIPRILDNTEPLHAIYSKACIRPIEDLLQQGELRIAKVFPKIRVRYVTESELSLFDPEHLSFFNINTRDDLELAQRRARITVCHNA